MSQTLAPVAFSSWPMKLGHIAHLDRQFPSYLSSWQDGTLHLSPGDTHFGYVHTGIARVLDEHGFEYQLYPGHAFSLYGPARVESMGPSTGIVVSREGWRGFPYITGPIEREGRLKYIDGCTDSLLIPPVRLGDPCLNLLYFPPGIDQTAHTHPSDRIGMILSGRGRCHAWDRDIVTGEWSERTIDLVPGMIFTIHTDGKHKFSTPYGEELRVLAYHPESDFGPRDEDHPMLNRTMVDGVSASKIEAIRTK